MKSFPDLRFQSGIKPDEIAAPVIEVGDFVGDDPTGKGFLLLADLLPLSREGKDAEGLKLGIFRSGSNAISNGVARRQFLD
ncbi:MAG: hypothetical protein ACRDEA_08985 [Microcystaceae cyanobacterium]